MPPWASITVMTMAMPKVSQVTALGETWRFISQAAMRNEIGRLMCRPNQPSLGFIDACSICQVTASGPPGPKPSPGASSAAAGSSTSRRKPWAVSSRSAGRTTRLSCSSAGIADLSATNTTSGKGRSRTAKLSAQSAGSARDDTT